MDVHFHQAKDGKRNTEIPPEFLSEIAYECIDAGADVFMGTGPTFSKESRPTRENRYSTPQVALLSNSSFYRNSLPTAIT